jgi:hypothetical protein
VVRKLTAEQYLQFLDSDPKIIQEYKDGGFTIIVTDKLVFTVEISGVTSYYYCV